MHAYRCTLMESFYSVNSEPSCKHAIPCREILWLVFIGMSWLNMRWDFKKRLDYEEIP